MSLYSNLLMISAAFYYLRYRLTGTKGVLNICTKTMDSIGILHILNINKCLHLRVAEPDPHYL
jgi:hypothetical protein